MTRSIPIAVSTGSLYPLPTLESIRTLQEIGIQNIELTLQSSEFHLSFERTLRMPILPELMKLVQEGKLHVGSVHGPIIFWGHANNLWARREYLLHSIAVCRQLGASILVLHPLHLIQTQEAALDYLAGNVSLHSTLLPGVFEIFAEASSANVILALENIQDWADEIFFNSPANMSRFLQDIGHPAFGCTLDLMHAQFPELLDDFVDCLPTKIVNIHAADLLPPAHRAPLGKGVIEWKRVIPRLVALPHLRQITIELSHPQGKDILESHKLLSDLMS